MLLTHPGCLLGPDVVDGGVGGHHAGDSRGGVGHADPVGQAARGHRHRSKQLQKNRQ